MLPLYWRATTLSEVTGIILPSGWSPVPPLPLKETDYSRPPPGASIGLGAAGIGGGYGASSNFGNITINGGTIIARGSGGGAGIGGGYEVGSGTVTGNVTINGGYVTAIGGSSGSTGGAGIGSGENANYSGTVTINGGVVYAEGGADSTSIGSGNRAIGTSDNGAFTTGTGGNAVIVAPDGIGDPPASLTGTVFLSAMRAVIRARRWVRTVRFT